MDRMKDPYYAQLMFVVEGIICMADDAAREKGIVLNDSQVRSAVVKAMKRVQGGNPVVPEESERDKVLAKLVGSLVVNRLALRSKYETGDKPQGADDGDADEDDDEEDDGEDVTAEEWFRAMESVADSIKRRKGSIPGSRHYLDYVHKFVAKSSGGSARADAGDEAGK